MATAPNPSPDARHPLDIERTLDEMKELRQRLGFSQEQIAEMLGVDRTYISRWEDGKVRPEFDRLVMLWRLLHGLRIEAGLYHE